MRTLAGALASVALTGAMGAGAQQGSSPAIPIRTLAPIAARTTMPMRAVLGMIQMHGNGLLVNEFSARRLLLFDSTLTSFTVVRDSAAGLATSYGPRGGYVIPYLGDSLLFVDVSTQTLVVIDPVSRFGRAMAPPNPRDISLLTRPGAGVDPKGRLIYEGAFPRVGTPGALDEVVVGADSAPILRADLDARRVDTIARIKTVAPPRQITTMVAGKRHVQITINPLVSLDGWAMLPDGSVAIVRSHDYHIDWINANGTTSSSPKLPFDWRRLTDADKQKLVDSAAAVQRARDTTPVFGSRGGSGGCARVVEGHTVSVACSSTTATDFVPLAEIADYYPPLRSGAVRADRDNNLWILPTTSAQSLKGELVYDVVNRSGELFERVRVPEGRSIAGFGRGGVVYLLRRDDAAGGWFIERTHVVRAASGGS